MGHLGELFKKVVFSALWLQFELELTTPAGSLHGTLRRDYLRNGRRVCELLHEEDCGHRRVTMANALGALRVSWFKESALVAVVFHFCGSFIPPWDAWTEIENPSSHSIRFARGKE
jgi:hypothetical protein